MGTFLEEVISPIPSLVVLIPAGALAKVQQLPVAYLLWLAVLCGLGRVLGGSILYWLAQHLERVLLGKHRILGLTHHDVIRLSTKLKSQRAGRTWIVLFALHALPVFPGTLLSAGSGFIKIDYRIFATATFFGSALNACIYLWLGYMGTEAAVYLDHLGIIGDIATGIVLIVLLGWLIIRHKRKPSPSLARVKRPDKKSPDR